MSNDPLVSIVIPTLDEALSLPEILADLSVLTVPFEVVVSDGGSVDATVDVARRHAATVVSGKAGRGTQLRAGAATARAPLLCFLHADVRLDRHAAAELSRLARNPPDHASAFRLHIDAPGIGLRMIEAGTNLRGRMLGMPFGDQGLIVSRLAYDAAGGYPTIPLMEDVALVRALRRQPGIRLLATSVSVSGRRWRRDGAFRRTIMNLWLLIRYLAGEDPQRLVRRYRPEKSA